jgi:hypothetical protein
MVEAHHPGEENAHVVVPEQLVRFDTYRGAPHPTIDSFPTQPSTVSVPEQVTQRLPAEDEVSLIIDPTDEELRQVEAWIRSEFGPDLELTSF